MPRRGRKFDRHEPRPDVRYGGALLPKFINCLMTKGKKSVAERVVYDALELISQKLGTQEPLKVFETAIGNVKPLVEVKSRRVGGATYQVPVPVSSRRQTSLAFRWLLGACRSKKGRPMSQRLANELLAAFRGEGETMKKRDDVHRMADANKAFAHLAY